MLTEFKDFLFRQNALALAVGVIIGAAAGRVVSSIVADLLMPFISLVMPGGEWRSARIVLSQRIGPDGQPIINSLNYGALIGNVIDFVVVAAVVFLILRTVLTPEPAAEPPPTKTCPFCKETLPADATRCRACTSALT
jgi:large conductance mechanosensitive channel